MPLESMKLRLCDLLDRCLIILEEQPEYVFHMDAQTIVLEDYLTIRPAQREILTKMVTEGRLIVGPWYMQNDFYLTSGESTVRNLIEGHQLAAEFGRCDKIGYAPDQFGNISQMPQILADFGIDNFIFGRGLHAQTRDGNTIPSEFIWEGADGTRALAIHMRYWYNNAQHFSPDIEKAKILVEANERNFEGVAITPYILMMNGVDHTEAQGDLLPILEQLNRKMPDCKIKQYKMKNYIDDVKRYIDENGINLYIHKGELRQGNDWSLLKGTLSSRSYLKAANVKAQTLLENTLEPLYAMLELAGAKGAYSIDHFRYMWKQLMQNHPHDSICGCSCDEVHDHMEDNYARLDTTMRDMLDRGLKCSALHLDVPGKTKANYILAVINTTQEPLSGTVEVTIDIPKSDNAAGIAIDDGNGRRADFIVLSKSDAVRDGFSPLNLPGNFEVDRYKVLLRVDSVNPFAMKGYIVNSVKIKNKLEPAASVSEPVLENEFLRVTVSEDGCVDVFSKKLNRLFSDVLDIEDTADCGDSYIYWPDESDRAILGSEFPAEVIITEHNRMRQEITIKRDMTLPVCYDFKGRKRSDETAVNTVTLKLRLLAGAEQLEIDAVVNNISCDHRLRLLVDTGITAKLAVADIPFDIVRHGSDSHFPDTKSRVLPNSTFAALENSGIGFAVLTEGAHEFEHLNESTLAFTLVRATGCISRDVSSLKPSGGDQWMAPGNQCIRIVSLRFGLLPYEGVAEMAGVPVKSVQFRAGLATIYNSCDATRFSIGRAAVQDSRLVEFYFLPDPFDGVRIADNQSLITVDGNGVLVTAVKKAQDESGIVVRTVNLSENESTVVIAADGKIYTTNMSEDNESLVGSYKVQCAVDSKKIKTFKIR